MRNTRSFKVDLTLSIEYSELKARDQVLFALTDKTDDASIVAEYEVTKREKRKDTLKVHVEPIYQAPIHNGVKMNSLTLAKLALSVQKTKGILVNLTEQQFITLAKMLTN